MSAIVTVLYTIIVDHLSTPQTPQVYVYATVKQNASARLMGITEWPRNTIIGMPRRAEGALVK